MNNTSNSIEVRDLYKSFKVSYDKPQTLKERLLFWNRNKVEHKTVLKHINVDIRKGETVALIGTNGSGKSTLLKLMTKILYPNKGTLKTSGKLTSLLELGAGFHDDFTGRENIYFNASIFGLTRNEIDKRVPDIIAFSELEEFIDNPVRTYSSGMYMRLAFSIAINVDAEILLIDEILSVGDQHFQEKCFDRLTQLKESDKTIVIVSHDLNSIRNLCDRAVWIYKGEIHADGAVDYVIEEYLHRIALDHKAEYNKNKDNFEALKKDKYKGLVYIDGPVAFTKVNSNEKNLEILGWEISDCPVTKIKLLVDDKEVTNVERYDRPDVFVVYEGLYGGGQTNEKAGWRVEVDISDLEEGLHDVCLISLDDEGKEIARKETSFQIVMNDVEVDV